MIDDVKPTLTEILLFNVTFHLSQGTYLKP